ncbi:MAG: hypothetical protein M3198_00930 [Actinomycetota bacterium]|nr:hypothetical protein [Actinomycetota bacterium]
MSPRLILALVLALVVPTACTDQARERESPGAGAPKQPGSSQTSPRADSSQQNGRESLLYLEGRTIRSLDLTTGAQETLGRLPSVDAVSAPGGRSIAYVVAAEPGEGHEDFVADPELHVRDVQTGSDVTIGPGFSPLWSPDGRHIAYLESSESRVCEGETCSGLVSVVVADVVGEERRTLLEEGGWVLLGWLADRLVVTDRASSSKALVVDDAGRSEDLGLVASEFWGASPDGAWIVEQTDTKSTLLLTGGGTPEKRLLDTGDRILAQGAWAPSSDRLAAVLLPTPCCGGASELGLVSLEGGVEVVPGSRGAEGPVIWGPASDRLVYARAAGKGGLRLEAVHCDLAGGEDCTSLFSWPRGVALLAITDL